MDRLTRKMHDIAMVEFPKTYSVGLELAKLSGKTDGLDVIALLRAVAKDEEPDPGLTDLLNKFLTLAKLTHGDSLARHRDVLRRRAMEKIREEDIEAERRRKYWREETDDDDDETERYRYSEYTGLVNGVPGIGAHIGEPPKLSRRDQYLNFIDRVNSGSCDVLSDEEKDLADDLKTLYGLELSQKGWLVKTWEFHDKSAVQSARHIIVSTKSR